MSKILTGITAFTSMFWIMSGCQKPENGWPTDDDDSTTADDDTTDDVADDDDTGDDVGFELTLIENPYNPFSVLVEVTVTTDARVHIEYASDNGQVWQTPDQTYSQGETDQILVLGLTADTSYKMKIVAEVDGQVWTSSTHPWSTAPLFFEMPDCHVSSMAPIESHDPREVFCTNTELASNGTQEGLFFCINRAGEPVWSMQHPDGLIMLALQPLQDGGFASTGSNESKLVFFDNQGALTKEYGWLWFEDRTRFWHDWINVHEVIEIREGQWAGKVAFLTINEDWPDGITHLGGGIIIFDPLTEEVLWDWNAHGERLDNQPLDSLMPYHRYGIGGTNDEALWQHPNAFILEVAPDGHEYFWISMRKQDWIVKIDTETDGVVWRFGNEGEFTLVDDLDATDPEPLPAWEWMYRQHAPELLSSEPGRQRFLLFDNGTVRPDEFGEPNWDNLYSRVLEFEIDQTSMLATVNYEYTGADLPDEMFYSSGYGDANLMPGGSSILYTKGADGPYIAEISYPDGEELWRFECSSEWYFYRALFFPSIYSLHE